MICWQICVGRPSGAVAVKLGTISELIVWSFGFVNVRYWFLIYLFVYLLICYVTVLFITFNRGVLTM